MCRYLLLTAAPLMLSTGCAMNDHGWSGVGAEPFDQAIADCRARTQARGGDAGRKFAIDTCMAQKGWTRTER